MAKETLIQSYVKDQWFVSTIYRQSSASHAPDHWYYETMVWPWDSETRRRGERFTDQQDSGLTTTHALESHFQIVRALMLESEQ